MISNNYVEVVSLPIPPTSLDFYIDQGSDFTAVVRLKDLLGDPRDISGKLFRGQFRRHWLSANTNSLTVTTSNVETAEINISLSANVSANIIDGRYVYNVEMFSANSCIRVLEGMIILTPDVTR